MPHCLSVCCLPVTACGRWVWQVLYAFLYIERGVRSIDKIASNYTVRAGFGIGFSLRCWRCWRFCQLANCFFVLALVSPPPYFHSPPTLMCQRRGKAGGAGTLACAAWQSSGLDSLFSWHSNTYAPPSLPRPWPGGTGLVIKYAGYQCQWCQKFTPAAKVARKEEAGGTLCSWHWISCSLPPSPASLAR